MIILGRRYLFDKIFANYLLMLCEYDIGLYYFFSPDQNVELIYDYVKQSLAGRYLPFHTVSYCSNDATIDVRMIS